MTDNAFKPDGTSPSQAAVYSYTPMTPQAVDALARDIDARKVWGTWLMAPGQDPSDCFLPLAHVPPAVFDRFARLNLVHSYAYMSESTGKNSKGQPTFMAMKFIDKVDMLRIDKRIAQIRAAITRSEKHEP